MRVLPILFNTDMVRAILDGRKTVTRRLPSKRIENKWDDYCDYVSAVATTGCTSFTEKQFYEQYPPYQPGDILYVRETWWKNGNTYFYKAGCSKGLIDNMYVKWRPSIHMPKEAARIWLKVTDVRVERLQDITEIQTEEEGFFFKPPCLHLVSQDAYCDLDGPCSSPIKYCDMGFGELFGMELWDSTIKKSDLDRYGWDANPWVLVIEFKRCEKPEEK